MTTRNIVPRATGEGQIGTSAKTWNALYVNDASVTNGVTAGTFTGNLTGNVTGNVTGNADTATNATNATNDANGNAITSTYLPLTGGTISGVLSLATQDGGVLELAGDHSDSSGGYIGSMSGYGIRIAADAWGSDASGSKLELHGRNASANAGRFALTANDGTNSASLQGNPDGTLTWAGFPLGVIGYLGDSPSGQTTTFTLPEANGWYIVFTGHNATPGANTIWSVRTSGNTCFQIATAGNSVITMSVSNHKKISVKSTSGLINVSYMLLEHGW